MKRLFIMLLTISVLALGADNTGKPLYDTDRNPVMLGVDISDSLPQVRWVAVDSTGALVMHSSSPTPSTSERLYPYFTSGIVDSTFVDSLYLFPMPVVSFWLRNISSTDTLYASWVGPAFPASYVTINPLETFGLEGIWRPDSLNGLFLDSSADSLPWEIVVLSDSLYIQVIP